MMKLALFLTALVCSHAVVLQYHLLGEVRDCAYAGTCVNHDYKLLRELNDGESSEELSVLFAITQDAGSCDSVVDRISDPNSPEYTNYLTFEEVIALMENRPATDAVENWLTEQGISFRTTPDGGFVRATATLAQWSELLDAEFKVWQSQSTERQVFRATSVSVPIELSEHIEFVGDFIDFPKLNRIAQNLRPLSPEATTVTPQLLWSHYKINPHTVSNTDPKTGSTMSVFESLGQDYSPDDLTTFESKYSVPTQAVYQVKGSNNPSNCEVNPNSCAEANLDVQWIIAVANGGPLTYWSIPANGDIFLEWIEKVAADPNPPLVYSISYGGSEAEEQQSIVKRFNTEVCKMAARGISVMTASGDDGVCGNTCRGNQGACEGNNFSPQYPASCPYVTTVGATQGPEVGSSEKVCMSNTGGLITSGGGFSGVFEMPKWQASQAQAYVKNGPNMPPTRMFHSSGRAYPDVSMMGHNYPIVIGGQTYVGSGTSASSPVFAATITLVNDQRISAGKKPLGFLNPILYSLTGTAFNDITVGENNCAAGQSSPACCQYGFNATTGWDASSGLGSVNFQEFAKQLVAH